MPGRLFSSRVILCILFVAAESLKCDGYHHRYGNRGIRDLRLHCEPCAGPFAVKTYGLVGLGGQRLKSLNFFIDSSF